MSKYQPLQNYLINLKQDTWTASFSAIEGIINARLPQSANLHPAWWANQENGSQSQAWVTVGWATSEPNFKNKTITFNKVGTTTMKALMKNSKVRDYSNCVDDILQNYGDYYDAFAEAATFSGPSLYFHNKALLLRDGSDTERFLESIYSVLVSWGMHRMGSRGAKMVHFSDFYDSVISAWSAIEEAKTFNHQSMTDTDWLLVHKIYESIEIMEGKTHIVGKSKVMAHLLPDIIAPVDRQYTLDYLHGNKGIKTNHQWDLMRSIMINFYHPIDADNGFQRFANELVTKNNGIGWNTSRLKVIDNLVIGAIKKKKNMCT